jgi:glycosyltransferase involved in cell wall biosynthesis
MSKPKFTVILPVKDRSEYLGHTLKTCMMQEYENLEIIVSDDCSSDKTQEVVLDLIQKDIRIKYYRHDSPIGMRENFEFAINQVQTGYLIALGGDDGLLPGGIENMYKILNETKLQLLTWPAALYSFPGVIDSNGGLIVYHKRGVRIIDSKLFLNDQSKKLWYLNDIECPMFYVKGVVDIELVKKVKKRSIDGSFYSCATPDGFSGIVLAGEVDKFVFSGEPFSIFGMSSSSQGLAYLSNDEKAKRDSDTFFNDSLKRPMHKDLASQPYSPLITLMTADYLLTCKDLIGWPGDFQKIDFKKVIINSIKELADGIYGEDRVARELDIVWNISKLHGLEAFFLKAINKTKRNVIREQYSGNGISLNAYFFDAKSLGINNIVDAAYSAKNIYKLYSMFNFYSVFRAILNSVLFRLRIIKKTNFYLIDVYNKCNLKVKQ